jgi:hypothetical protein
MKSISTAVHAALLALCLASWADPAEAFTSLFVRQSLTSPTPTLQLRKHRRNNEKLLFFSASSLTSSLSPSASDDLTASLSSSGSSITIPQSETALTKEQRKKLIRKEGGLFAFDTKYGALNPFAIYYGLTAIALGIPWYFALSLYQAFQWLTRERFDKNRRIPIFLSHLWGVTLLRLTRCYPKMENREILKKFYKE